MKAICSLLPGGDIPILFSDFSEDEEEEESVEYDTEVDTENEEIFNESVIRKDTNGAFTSLPQSTQNYMQPLTVECDPVSKYFPFFFIYSKRTIFSIMYFYFALPVI